MRVRYFFAFLPLWLGVVSPPGQAAPPPLSVYGQLPVIETMAISPSGAHVALIGMAKGERRLLIFDKALKLVNAIPVVRTKIRGLEWAGDQAVLVHYSNTTKLAGFTTSKAELSSVIVVPMDGGKIWRVFAKQPGITGGVMGTYAVIQRGGRWYGYFGSFLRALPPAGRIEPDLFEVDLQTQDAQVIARRSLNPGHDIDWLVDGNGAVGAWSELIRDSGNWTIRNGNHKVLATGRKDLGQFRLVGFTPDGADVVYAVRDTGGTSDKKAGRDRWFRVPLAGGTPQPYLDDTVIVSYFEDREHRLLGVISNEATGDGHFFNAHNDQIYKSIQNLSHGKRVSLLDYNDSFDQIAVTTEGPGDPVSWWLMDMQNGSARSLGTSYNLTDTDVGPMRMVAYKAADGLKMEGVLTLPPASVLAGRDARALPAVVLPHGGPAAHDVAGFDWMAQAFASRGYAVFQPNFRGSTGYGTAFEQAGNGEWSGKMQTDISDGLAELVRQGIVDPGRVCIVGASYGGYAALAGVSLQQGIYRCAVSYAGISDLKKYVYFDKAETSNYDPLLTRELITEIGGGRDLKDHDLEAASPIRAVDKVRVPVLLIHGNDDTVVNFAQSKNMAEALRKAGKQVEFVPLPGEDHWLSNSETRVAMLQSAVDFVLKYNPPEIKK
jgi:dipeptidyl aminopeptidase/acylaminoacyl peptidase